MTSKIAGMRLHCQRLASGSFARPEGVVRHLGAVQAQEYHFAKWGLALRTRGASDAAVERAFAAGRILRTHVLRPTWHFVTPADIRWLLALTGPRVRAAVASADRALGITPKVITRANRTLAAALSGGAYLTRAELKAVLAGAGVRVGDTRRLAHVMVHAELDAVVCSGPRRGKQFTYALLDERVPTARLPSRDESLAELARRYFTGHGPAQLADFAWWSGLTLGVARAAVTLCGRSLVSEEIEGVRYWLAPSARRPIPAKRAAYLLPPFDEYIIGYRDRSEGRDPFSPLVVLGGRVVGTWGGAGPAAPSITLDLRQRLSRADRGLVDDAVRRYTAFLEVASR